MAAPGRPASTPSQTRTAEGGHPTGVVLADGSGRFGSTLWHLYPEIALASEAADEPVPSVGDSITPPIAPWCVSPF